MGIEVLIKRKFVAEVEQQVSPLMVRLRSLARSQPGYICSEALRCIEPCDQTEYLIRSTWNTIEDWKNWFNSETRQAIQQDIDAITGEETKYWIYEPLVDGFFEKFQ
jgi:heme-degrading monooxygenase HmoA